MVASDVNPAPNSVKRIAHSLGCKLFVPDTEISAREKSQLTKRYAERIKNSHENDALVAAIKAYNAHSYFFGKVKNALRRLGIASAFDEVAKSVLFRKSSSVRGGVTAWLKKRRRKK